MARVRPAVCAALLLVLLAVATAAAAVPRRPFAPLAAVGWPPSAGLVVAEVVTGGASASDEYVEVANAGIVPADLAGLEVAYSTSSGATVTRKAAWTSSLLLAPGQHLLLANSAGIFAPIADALYSGGLAATGGAIVLRPTGGTAIDAVGWGDAVNGFAEGSPAPAPAVGQSIERRPGGLGGNAVDTNSNAADFVVNAAPVPQGLASGPIPPPSATPSMTPQPSFSETPAPSVTPPPSASSAPSASPTPVASASPEPTPTPVVSAEPSLDASPSVTPSPTPAATPVPTTTAPPSDAPTDSPPPSPTAAVTPAPVTPAPSDSLPPSPTPSPTAAVTPSPAPTSTPSPSPSASPAPTAEPTPEPVTPIVDARQLPDGATATVEGVLTTALGALESGRTGFVQDASGGIALYLGAAFPEPLPAGTLVRVSGSLASRYGERTLRIVGADVVVEGLAGLPAPIDVVTSAAGEALEGLRLRVSGLVTEAPAALADGLGITVDDGSGPVRIVVEPDALGSTTIAAGMSVVALGPLGQRDSTGTGIGGYRVFATLPGEFTVLPPAPPSPSQSPSTTPAPSASDPASPTVAPSSTPSATPVPSLPPTASPSVPASSSPSPVPSPSATATPSPTPTPAPLAVAAARAVSVGGTVTVRGVVTAEAGRIGTPPLFVIGDATGGLPIRLADGMAAPARAALVQVRGTIAAPFGQTELRLAAGGLKVLGPLVEPDTVPIAAAAVGEGTEGRLVSLTGTITSGVVKSTSGDLAITVRGADGTTVKVSADASAAMAASLLKKGRVAAFTGIVGQRASRKGALDGYRLWLRDRGDVADVIAPVPSPSASASATPRPSATPTATATPAPSATPAPTASAGTPALEPIATARVRDGLAVTIEGLVTAGRSLLDATGRRAVLEDSTAAVELYLASPDAAVKAGARLRVTGVVGRAWGAPRVRVTAISVIGSGSPTVIGLRAAPGPETEWRLVRVTGTVGSVHRSGARWVAELETPYGTVPIIALAGAAIPATAIEKGRAATVTGIVRRPYPTASDRRYAILPRRAADIVLGAAGSAGSSPVAGAQSSSGSGTGAVAAGGDTGAVASPDVVTAVDLKDLAASAGRRVRVGGLITEVLPEGLRLDDGTGTALVVLRGEAADLAGVVSPGDALDAAGTVELGDEPTLVVTDPADVELAGDPGAGEASPDASAAALAALVLDSTPPALGMSGPSTAAPEPGVVMSLLAALAGMAVALVLAARRLRDRRRDRAVVRRRLETWAGQPAAAAVADA